MSHLEKAVLIAAEAHKGRKDRYGYPFILHPIRVMMRLKAPSEKEMIVALLHDIIEKTIYSLERLRQEGFSKEIITAVECLTKREQEPYREYIQRVRAHPLARTVKRADLEDHLEIIQYLGIANRNSERMAKYDRALKEIIREEQAT